MSVFSFFTKHFWGPFTFWRKTKRPPSSLPQSTTVIEEEKKGIKYLSIQCPLQITATEFSKNSWSNFPIFHSVLVMKKDFTVKKKWGKKKTCISASLHAECANETTTGFRLFSVLFFVLFFSGPKKFPAG